MSKHRMRGPIQDRRDDSFTLEAADDVKTKVNYDEKDGVKDAVSGNKVKAEGAASKRAMKAREYNAERSEDMARDIHEYKKGRMTGAQILDKVSATVAVETAKAFQAVSEVTSKLESTGIMDRGGLWENLKAGGLFFKGYRIGMGSLFSSLILMKSMRWVLDVDDDTSDEESWDSIKRFFKSDGREKFAEVRNIPRTLWPTAIVGGTHLNLVGATADDVKAANVPVADIDDEMLYNVLIAVDIAGVWFGFRIANMSGALLRTLGYLDPAGYIAGTGFPFAAWVPGQVYVLMATPIAKPSRFVGALDLAGAAKTAVFLGAAGLNRTVGVIYPFVSNSLGNLFTDAKLPDFIGRG